MTLAVMDLGPRVDPKPSAKPGASHDAAESSTAFAEAVDQAVGEASGRSDTVGRKDSERESSDRRTHGARHDRAAPGGDDGAAGDAPAIVVAWAPAPHDLRAAHGAGHGTKGRTGSGDGDDPVTVVSGPTTAPARRAGSPSGPLTPLGDPHTGGAPGRTGVRAEQVSPPSAGAADGTAARSVPASDAPPRTGVQAAAAHGLAGAPAGPATHTEHHGPGGGQRRATSPGAPDGSRAPVPSGATIDPGATGYGTTARATATTAPPAPGGDTARPAPTARIEARATPPVDDEARGHRAGPAKAGDAQPGAGGGAASSPTGAPTGTAANTPASTATSTVANQVPPAAVHVPTAVGATVNSTPVAVPTPVPTPFTQAQPDVANILAQLRGRTDGTYQLRAQVHPAELGAVAITATVHHGALTVVLSPDQTAQQAISQSLPQLRQHLADQGFTGVNVGLGSPDQSGHQGRSGGDRETHAQGSDHSVLHGKDTAVRAVDRVSAGRPGGTPSALDLML